MSGMILKCRRCGHDLPPLGDEEQAAFLAGGSSAAAEHAPGQCPHELAAAAAAAAAAPVRRVFRATMVVVEVTGDGLPPLEVPPTDLIGHFSAQVEATTPGAALEPGGELADLIGQKWARLASHADLADAPPVLSVSTDDEEQPEVRARREAEEAGGA